MNYPDCTTSSVPCKVCGEVIPATAEYFPPYKARGKSYLRNTCRVCWRDNRRVYSSQTREQERARRRKRRIISPDKVAAEKKRSHERHRETDNARSTRWFDNHVEHVRELARNNYYANRAERIQTAMINTVKRMARKRNLPDQFTAADWQCGLTYFDYRCAICGRPADDERTLAMDHWVPLTEPNCPGTVPTNIVPLCHGRDGCNNSKGNSDPVKWLNRKFGAEFAKTKLAAIATYFEWIGLQ